MRLLLGLCLLVTTGAFAAQEPDGLSTDPRLHIDHAAPHAHDANIRCHKDHSGLELAAAEPESDAQARLDAALADGGSLVMVAVGDLDCPYCAAAIERAFEARSDVAAAYVDLRARTVSLVVEAHDEISDSTIRKIVNRRGYDVTAIDRNGPPPPQQ